MIALYTNFFSFFILNLCYEVLSSDAMKCKRFQTITKKITQTKSLMLTCSYFSLSLGAGEAVFLEKKANQSQPPTAWHHSGLAEGLINVKMNANFSCTFVCTHPCQCFSTVTAWYESPGKSPHHSPLPPLTSRHHLNIHVVFQCDDITHRVLTPSPKITIYQWMKTKLMTYNSKCQNHHIFSFFPRQGSPLTSTLAYPFSLTPTD